MLSISSVPPPTLSLEDLLHSNARTPKATRFDRRRRQIAQEKLAAQSKTLKTPKSINEPSPRSTQSTKVASTREAPAPENRRLESVEQPLADIVKNAAISATTKIVQQQVSSPSAKECTTKITIAAFEAIQAVLATGLQAINVERSVPSPIKSQVAAVPTPVYDDDDGRFEDAEEVESLKDVEVRATQVEVVRATPMKRVLEVANRPGQQRTENTDKNPQNLLEDVVMGQNEQEIQDIPLPDVPDDKPEAESGIQNANPGPLIFGENREVIEQKDIDRDPSQSPHLLREQLFNESEEMDFVEESLDELDIALLRLGASKKLDDIINPRVSQSPEAPEIPDSSKRANDEHTRELPIRQSLKRASPDIDEQEEHMSNGERSPGSPPKRFKHLVQGLRSIEDEGVQNFENNQWNGEQQPSDCESEDHDSTYNPRGSRKKKSTGKRANKTKARLVEYEELDFTSSSKQPLFTDDDEFEPKNPINENAPPFNRPSFSTRNVNKVIKKSRVQKGRKRKAQPKKPRRLFADLGEFRRLDPVDEAGNHGWRTPLGLPIYSDGFTAREARPIGRVMPVSRSRPRAVPSGRPAVLRLGELVLTESCPVIAKEKARSQKPARKGESRSFRQLRRVDEKEARIQAEKGKASKNLVVRNREQQKEQVHVQVREQIQVQEQEQVRIQEQERDEEFANQESEAQNQEQEASDRESELPSQLKPVLKQILEVQSRRREVQVFKQEPKAQVRESVLLKNESAVLNQSEATNQDLEVQDQELELPSLDEQLEVPNQEPEVQAEIIVCDPKLVKDGLGSLIAPPDELIPYNRTDLDQDHRPILRDSQPGDIPQTLPKQSQQKSIISEQDQYERCSLKLRSSKPLSSALVRPGEFRQKNKPNRRVSWNEMVDVQRKLLLVPALRIPKPETDSETSEQEEQDQADSGEESSESVKDSSSDESSDSESDQSEKSEDESGDDMKGSQESERELQEQDRSSDSEQDESNASEEDDEEVDNDSDHENAASDDHEGDETEDEDDEMLLESQIIESKEPLARPDDSFFEEVEELLSNDDDMMDIDERGDMDENMDNEMEIPETQGYQESQEADARLTDRYDADRQSLQITQTKSGSLDQVRESQATWIPRIPISGDRFEIDEDIVDFSSPLHRLRRKTMRIQYTNEESEAEGRESSPEISESQVSKKRSNDPDLSFRPENVSNYFSRASQELQFERGRAFITKRRSGSISSCFKAAKDDEEGDGASENGGMLSKTQMFQRMLSSRHAAASPQSLEPRESQMPWRPDPEDEEVKPRGNGLKALTRRASAEFGTIPHHVAKRRTFSLPFVPPWKK